MKITQLDQLCERNGKCHPRETEAKPSFGSKTISTAKKIPAMVKHVEGVSSRTIDAVN